MTFKGSLLLPALAAAALVLAACGGGGEPQSKAPAQQPRTPAAAQLATGPVVIAGVRVAAPVVDLGRVPLSTPIPHAWTLSNTGSEPVTLGQPRIQTLEGC